LAEGRTFHFAKGCNLAHLGAHCKTSIRTAQNVVLDNLEHPVNGNNEASCHTLYFSLLPIEVGNAVWSKV
jgi:hypothetical protein